MKRIDQFLLICVLLIVVVQLYVVTAPPSFAKDFGVLVFWIWLAATIAFLLIYELFADLIYWPLHQIKQDVTPPNSHLTLTNVIPPSKAIRGRRDTKVPAGDRNGPDQSIPPEAFIG